MIYGYHLVSADANIKENIFEKKAKVIIEIDSTIWSSESSSEEKSRKRLIREALFKIEEDILDWFDQEKYLKNNKIKFTVKLESEGER